MEQTAAPTNKRLSNDAQFSPEDVRICLVEDNPIHQKLIKTILEKRGGYSKVDVLANGKDAVDAVKQRAADGEPYHIIIMDIFMPVMNGIEATNCIRQDPCPLIRDVPVIGLHAHAAGYKTVAELLALGMTECITRPLDANQLLRAMRDHAKPLV